MTDNAPLALFRADQAYPRCCRNDDVHCALRRGDSFIALLGETAPQVDAGQMFMGGQTDSGTMQIARHQPCPARTRAARAAGVGMVFQHFSLF